jgi:hypothetical protein
MNFGTGSSGSSPPLSCGEHPHSSLDFDDEFNLDRQAKRQACNAEHDAAGELILSEDLKQKLGRSVRDVRMISEITLGGDIGSLSDPPLPSGETAGLSR